MFVCESVCECVSVLGAAFVMATPVLVFVAVLNNAVDGALLFLLLLLLVLLLLLLLLCCRQALLLVSIFCLCLFAYE